MNPEQTQAARLLWEWLPVRDEPAPADLILVLGNKSEALPGEAAELYRRHLAPYIVLSGGKGRLTKNDALGEAERYRAALLALGVPDSVLFLERNSTNTGQNIDYSRRLVEEKGLALHVGIVVTTAMLSRRHKATMSKKWPAVRWLIDTPVPLPFAERLAAPDVTQFVNLMTGEVARLQYYPARGFMDEVALPAEIIAAKDLLVRAGYDRFARQSTLMYQ